jgi:carbon monoxide dehydrogenase subunit G
MRISHELTIRRDPESVFHWIEDPQLASRWQPGVVDYEITKVSPGMVGTEFREHIRGASGSIEMRGRVTACARNALMEFDLTGRGIRVRARYVLTPAASGTGLRVDTEIRLGGWISWLFEPFVRGKALKQARAELELLRNLCEAGLER